MALVLFAISLFGIMSALRLCARFRDRAVIPSQFLTKIGTGSCALMVFFAFLNARALIYAFVSQIIACLALWLLLHFIERRETEILKSEVPSLLDRWILNMKLGHAVSAARTAALRDSSVRARTLLEPLFVRADVNTKPHLILDEKLRRELIEISFSSHSTLARLENTRAWLRKSDDFRRKSGQALRQTAIQSLVLLLLLFALAIFTVRRHGWRRNSDLVTASFILSGLGILSMRHLARKKRWKI